MNSIQTKIIVFSIFATLIPSLGLGLLSFQQNETMSGEHVTRELRALAQHANRELDLWIKEQALAARELATSKILIDGLSPEKQSQKNKQASQHQSLNLYLEAVHKRLEAVLELTVVDANGKFAASSTDAPFFTTLPADWLEQASLYGEIVDPPHWSIPHATAALRISVPILSEDNFALGALIMTFDLHAIRPNLKDKEKSPFDEVFLLDREGKVLLTSNTSLHHQQALSMDTAIVARLLETPGNYQFFLDLQQEKVAGLAYPSDKMPITIVASRSHESIYDAWKQQRNLLVWFIGILLFIVTSIAFGMSHAIVSGLQKLIHATQKIVAGDLNITLTSTQRDEIGQLTQTFNQMTDRLRQNQTEIAAAGKAMRQKNKQLERLSITDGLTGLYNRNKLNAIINDQLARFKRNKRPFAVLMIDIDHFKTLNDGFGHIAGDEIIAAVAQKITQSIRNIDFAARYGGDEFVVILTESTAGDAVKTAERLREQVATIRCAAAENAPRITLSIGAIQCEPADSSLTILLARVDGALYEAKRAGRDRVFNLPPPETIAASDS